MATFSVNDDHGLRMPAARPIQEGSAKWGPLLVGAVCLAPFLGMLLWDGRVIGGSDYSTYYIPFHEFARDEIFAFRVPLWTPLLAGGVPFHAGQQASLCYPLLVPLVLLCGANHGIKVSLFLHVLLCFAGQYCLARRLQVSRPGASFSAVAATYGAFAMEHLGAGHITIVFGYALLPWFFCLLLRLIQDPGPGAAATLGVFVALFEFGSHPQILYYTLAAGACWVGGSLACGAAARHRAAVARWLGIAASVTILLSAVQWLPALELARDAAGSSERGSSRHASMYAMDGADLLRLFVPRLNGDEQAGIEPFERGRYEHERNAYLGWLTMPLTVFGLARASAARWQWGIALLCLAAAEIGLGANSPMWRMCSAAIPGLLWFRCQGRIYAIVSVFLSLLAARGLDAIVRGEPRGTRAACYGVTAVIVAGAAIVLDSVWRLGDRVDLNAYVNYAQRCLPNEYISLVILILATIAVLVFARSAGARYPRAAYGVPLVLLWADLGEYNLGYVRLERPRTQSSAPPAPPNADWRFAYLSDFSHASRVSLQFSRVVPTAVGERRMAVNTNDGGMLPGAVERLYQAIEANSESGLNLAACRWIYGESSRRWRSAPDALPRFRFIRGPAAALCELPVGRCGPRELELLRAALGRVAIVRRERPRRLEIDINAPEDGTFVLADTYYPGWHATVDGKPVEMFASHGVFRAIAMSAGKHLVTFSYDPLSFKAGSALSASGAALVILLFSLSRRWRSCADLGV